MIAEKLAALSTRERVLVVTLSIVAIFGVAWFGVWVPLDTQYRQSVQASEDAERDLASMKVNAAKLMAAKGNAPAADTSQAAYIQMDQLLKTASLKPSQLTPSGDDTVRLRFDLVEFDKLVAVMANAQQKFGLSVQSATLEAKGNGQTQAQLELSR
ncbi:MAG: type II secretion system protein M [Gammaproteobacteria bacterium]|nr:type II secretion system protein M [Gammaproteobacteria bacterium]